MKIPNQIKNIIFDLGGVIMDLDIEKTKKSLALLGFEESMFHLNDPEHNNIFVRLERGQVTEKAFFENLRKLTGKPVAENVLKEAWNGMIADFQLPKILLLQELRSRYRTFLLSNTNSIHIARCNEILHRKFHLTGLEDLFEKTYYSYETGWRKPEPEIFIYVLTHSHLKPEETLFVDDSQEHVDAARTLGLQTHLHPRNAPLTTE